LWLVKEGASFALQDGSEALCRDLHVQILPTIRLAFNRQEKLYIRPVGVAQIPMRLWHINQ